MENFDHVVLWSSGSGSSRIRSDISDQTWESRSRNLLKTGSYARAGPEPHYVVLGGKAN